MAILAKANNRSGRPIADWWKPLQTQPLNLTATDRGADTTPFVCLAIVRSTLTLQPEDEMNPTTVSNAVQIQVLADAEALTQAAATEFVKQAKQAIATSGRFTVALSGGSTPKSLYALLATEPWRRQIPWSHVHFFWGDERHVPPDHADSNYRMTQERLLFQVPVPAENVHRIQTENPDASSVAAGYEQAIRQFFKLHENELPQFDLVLLGMGPDGHTASLFPHTKVIHEQTRLVAAPWVEKFKTYRITLTPPVLNNANHIIFFVTGAEKAETLKAVLEGEYQPDRFPSQLIQPTHGTVLWMVDQAAASLLSQSASNL
ncbi:MAG: 6-phosphogluconolactonase [Leptolyngbya sp. BL-A-14]